MTMSRCESRLTQPWSRILPQHEHVAVIMTAPPGGAQFEPTGPLSARSNYAGLAENYAGLAELEAAGIRVETGIPTLQTGNVMQVRLLGPVDAVVDGEARAVSGLRRKAVLAVLALHPGEVVSTGRLADAVWGRDAPATAMNT